MTINIHATAIAFKSKGILIVGNSGSGKSDLALRLISNHQARLIADDRVDITTSSKKIFASPPEILKGLLEVRGVGIINMEHVASAEIKMVVELIDKKPERMPLPEFYKINDIKLPLIKINPFEISSPEKVLAALSLLCGF